MQLFTANFIKYGVKCKCDWKKHATKLQFYCLWRITCVSMLSMTQHLAYKLEFLELS